MAMVVVCVCRLCVFFFFATTILTSKKGLYSSCVNCREFGEILRLKLIFYLLTTAQPLDLVDNFDHRKFKSDNKRKYTGVDQFTADSFKHVWSVH